MSTQHLFLALPLPAPVQAVIAALTGPSKHIRWTATPQLHVTLRFLGEVPDPTIDSLVERLEPVNVEPFILSVEQVGAFPVKGPPRVLWAGLGSGHPRLHQLRQRVDDALIATGVEIDLRLFHPHITVGRCDEHARHDAARWLRVHHDFAGPAFNVDMFALYASTLHDGGAIHRLVRSFPLLK